MTDTARDVRWGALPNVRDLGGLPVTGGGETVRGRVFRSPRLDELDAAGWRELAASGVRTIVDVRRPDEVRPLALRPGHVDVVAAPVEIDEVDFMREWLAHLNTPRYYRAALERWPDLMVAAFRAIAAAPRDHAVVVHCASGRDRTGMVTAMLLRLVGVPDDAIVADYVRSVRAMNAWFREHPLPHEPGRGDADLERWVDTTTGLLREFLHAVDAEAYLRRHGLGDEEVTALRARLLEP